MSGYREGLEGPLPDYNIEVIVRFQQDTGHFYWTYYKDYRDERKLN